PILADEGKRLGRVCLLRNITQFKELDLLKSEFVATVSHDLRSPLTLMHGYTTMLEMVGDLNEQQADYVRKINSGVESMSRLVNNLLDLQRIEAGLDLDLDMISVGEVIGEIISTLQLRANQKRIQVNKMIPDQVPMIEADRDLIKQALQNLIDNAIKYTRSGGEVWVRARVHQDKMLLEVEDNGIGIAPVDQPRLFEKFFRAASRETKRVRGSGLGLAIVKSIVERHGGRIRFRSQLGKGSIFYVFLPLQRSRGVEQRQTGS
ncbi:MAG: HAMP domain-containing sensor histidine kinase, partial [Anaerolineales bacterium]